MQTVTEEQRILTQQLAEAAKAYYNTGTSPLSDRDYDRMYDRLLQLEQASGTALPNSPTQVVGAKVLDGLKTVQHRIPALSLKKTKVVEDLTVFLGNRIGCLSWKMDGLTAVAEYDSNGKLYRLATRGDGFTGKDVTHAAPYIKGLPMQLTQPRACTVRGECYLTYADYEVLNRRDKAQGGEGYSNARNLAAGSLTMLDSGRIAKRRLRFMLFECVEGFNEATYSARFTTAKSLGFDVVPHTIGNGNAIVGAIAVAEKNLGQLPYPTDGLVLAYNDIAYGQSLGTTGKYPRGAMAFKWRDDAVETKLLRIVWQVGRTGAVTPVAEFEPIEIEGSVVSRATLHNVEYVRNLRLMPGDTIGVYKANMIIPQVAYNLDADKHPNYDIQVPDVANAQEEQVVQRLSHFASRNAVNILGISDKMLRKLYSCGVVNKYCDSLYTAAQNFTQVFGEKTAQNLCTALNNSRTAEPWRVLAGLGVPGVGTSTAKTISTAVNGNLTILPKLSVTAFTAMQDIGEVTAKGIFAYFHDEENIEELRRLAVIFPQIAQSVTTQAPAYQQRNTAISGKTFVITGSLTHFKNRDALVADIESRGGKTASSVTSKTDYLINNDSTSTSGKNKKAAELNIPVITEETYLKMSR